MTNNHSQFAIWVSVGEVAERTGLSISAIHFYERKGLIHSIRNESNHRRYPRVTFRILSIVRVAQNAGYTLEQIKAELSSLPDRAAITKQDWGRLSAHWRDDLNQKIEQLTLLRDNMTECIGCGCLSMEKCALVNPDDILSRQGPGPHFVPQEPSE
ncbi:redox-sensitive transcriptional activator SoxR [Photobacterium sp. TY1-4]|uniref:redox-sensitive transcriptional activator SoxR n=1 Tax=Photobacterium sp. TY1-4 TaxID=2899122 RepID=UPI0021C00B34|nr:redox-sensitive transcriptional activator SoxR [Photobacterium sp. TY1-4]UXI03351.1 redox-sensitive transcriptional activator SoxR [Photobacterium sp. TY1-4]